MLIGFNSTLIVLSNGRLTIWRHRKRNDVMPICLLHSQLVTVLFLPNSDGSGNRELLSVQHIGVVDGYIGEAVRMSNLHGPHTHVVFEVHSLGGTKSCIMLGSMET